MQQVRTKRRSVTLYGVRRQADLLACRRMWPSGDERRSLAWRDVLYEWATSGCAHREADFCNNGLETTAGHILIRGARER